MKKIFMKWGLLGVLIISIFVVGKIDMTYADCAPGDSECLKKLMRSSYQNQVNENIVRENQELTEAGKKDACKTTPTSTDCSKSYSCEELFQTTADARKCNYDRCKAKNPLGGAANDMNYVCNCKYGVDGKGGTIGIPLNTNFPFIGSCLEKSGGDGSDEAALSVLPTVINALSKMLIVIILVVGVIMVIIGGIQWTMGEPKKGQEMIKKVAIGFALLGAMSAILALINPNFFK